MTDAETQLAGFFAQFAPAIARLGKALRARLQARLPGLAEVVYFYAGQGSLVISYSPTGRGYDAVCTLSLQPQEVRLYFARGPQLAKADPGRLLQGSGKMVRFVLLRAAADLDRAEIEALMVAALDLAKVTPVAGSKGAVIVKAEEQRQRAVRAKKAAKPAKAKRGGKSKG